MQNEDIIFGKDRTERIVCVEPKNELCEVFIQEPDGSITSNFLPNKYWILSDQPHSNKWVRLKGNNHYKYGLTFIDFEEWKSTKSFLKYKKQADIFSIYNQKEQFLIKNGLTYFKGLKHNEVSVLSFDIETDGLNKTENSRVFLISNSFRINGITEKRLFCTFDYKNDGEMIADWCRWVKEKNPSILTGYNIIMYDIPYLAHVAFLNGTELSLGRDGSSVSFNNYESELRKDQTQSYKYFKCFCYGREIADVFFIAVKTDTIQKKWTSLSLKTIIKEEGLEQPGRTFYDASLIRKNIFVPMEKEKIKAYAIDDAQDALNLLDQLSPPYFYSTQSIPKSYQSVFESASGSQINSILLRGYLQQGFSVPEKSEVGHFQGALSDGIPGKYSNCFKIDLISLYPSIIRQYEIYDRRKDPHGYFLLMANYFTEERLKNKKLYKETKDEYYNNLQSTQKTFANSLYGLLSTNGINFNSPKNAELITRKGREILNFTIKWATGRTYEEWNLSNTKSNN